jgi:hypothetical protein
MEAAGIQAIDILILSNGPGELVTWVKPVVAALRQQLGFDWFDRDRARISVVLSPCPNASGAEADIASGYPEVDRVQAAADFFPFLLFGKTKANWDWRSQGIVIFLGGDEFFPVVIGKRLGYKTLVYTEWEALWPGLIDRYAVMNAGIVAQIKPKYRDRLTVVGDLMLEAGRGLDDTADRNSQEMVGLLPGSKPAKLMQGVPLMLAIAQEVKALRPQVEFVIPVAPTLSLSELARYADAAQNPVMALVKGVSARLVEGPTPYLETPQGLRVMLHQTSDRLPPYDLLKRCCLCITTVGANTAELGALAVPMLVILPTNQLDAMRAWNGPLGILANLPGVGSLFAKVINTIMLRRVGLLAWPNIWAGKQIVPELVGELYPATVAPVVLDYLAQPERLSDMRSALQSVRGEAGAAEKLVQIAMELIRSL